ncbi:PepSY domain-containing protein [Lysinibacillus sp. NPDC056185]|uniref:PepSY domain-containing protein n=1 Tax=Lysinibacillus sp. NPDC056185 TaxID=3345739 RepID=UPI0039EF863E
MIKKLMIPVLAATFIGGAFAGNFVITSAFASSDKVETSQVETEKDDDNIAELQAKAKLSIEKAQEIALDNVTGTVQKSELEDEDGVVVYGFEIKTSSGDVKDVKIDAASGKVVKVEAENEDDGAEEND